MVKDQIHMNKWYGVRFRKAFVSDDYWYKINRYGGKLLIIWSIPIVLIGIATFFIPEELFTKGLIIMISFSPLLVIISAIESYLYSRKI